MNDNLPQDSLAERLAALQSAHATVFGPRCAPTLGTLRRAAINAGLHPPRAPVHYIGGWHIRGPAARAQRSLIVPADSEPKARQKVAS